MNRRAYCPALLSVLIVCLSGGVCQGYLQAQSVNTNATIETGQFAVVEGVVELKPKGASQYWRVSMGTPFRRGDLLKIAASAKATVICTDVTKHELTSGVHGLPCRPPSSGPQVISFDGVWVKVNPTRSDLSDLGIPIVIAPRKTKVLNPRPTLRWTPVTGVSLYRVTVRGQHLHWSADVSSTTEMVYPDDQEKQLTPGETYKLTVRAGDHTSDEEGVPGLGFTLLTPQQAQPVRDAEQKIRALGLPETAIRLLLAQLYAELKLNAEALELLRGTPAAMNEPAVAQLLGDLYFAVGLNRLAEEQHLRALNLAEQGQALLSQARAQYSLGQVYETLGNRDEAVTYWQRAQELYRQLGDNVMVEEIKVALARLQ